MNHTKKLTLLVMLGLVTFKIIWVHMDLIWQNTTNFYEHLLPPDGKYTIAMRVNTSFRGTAAPKVITSRLRNAGKIASSVLELPHGQFDFTTNSFAISHSLAEAVKLNESSAFVVVSTHGLGKQTQSLSVFRQEDQRSLILLAEFLQSASEYDVATCLYPSNKSVSVNVNDRDNGHVRNEVRVHQDRNWCRYARRNWSVVIRNTGSWSEMKFTLKYPLTEAVYHVQDCNIVNGPFLIRVDKFQEIGGWRREFGQTSLLDFFFRTKGKLRIAKLKECVWSRDITRTDRGPLQNNKTFVDYAMLGNEHKILRIIKEDGIEWTRCTASFSVCPEQPYTPSLKLPEVALPICCSAVNYNTLSRFKWAAEQLELEYRIVYGTLLGAIRSKAIIPWNFDVDVALKRYAASFKSRTLVKLQKWFGEDYYVGSHAGMPRILPLIPARLDLDTREFFSGPEDLEGSDELYSSQVQDAVQGMLPIKKGWRQRTYLDIYSAKKRWIKGSSVVTINGNEFYTVKDVDGVLRAWYGKNYLKPSRDGNWSGLSD